MSATTSDFFLEVDGVTKTFGGLTAVNNVKLTVKRDAIHAVIGPNGAGKTTFFNLLTGIYKPDAGHIRLDGLDISGKGPEQVAALGVARTFQNIRLFSAMTVLENVLIGHHIHIKTNYLASIIQAPHYRREEKRAKEHCEQLLDGLGLLHKKDQLARNLPYGEQRKLEIARALALKPRLLLLDEPAAGMNPNETDELMESILKIREKHGLTIVLIEHDMSMVMAISHRITVLEYGSVLAEGLPAEIRSHPRVIEAYLGKGAAQALGVAQ